MAVVTRRYRIHGPSNADLLRFVGPTAVQNDLYQGTTVDIDVDNAVAGMTETLDEYMVSMGFELVTENPTVRYACAPNVMPITLTDVPAGVVLVDGTLSDYFYLIGDGLGSTRQLDNPTGLIAAERRILIFEWEHAGADLLTFDTLYEFGNPGVPSYPAAGVRDTITATWNGSTLQCSYVQGYAT